MDEYTGHRHGHDEVDQGEELVGDDLPEDDDADEDAEPRPIDYETDDPYNYAWTVAAFEAIRNGSLRQTLQVFGNVRRAQAEGGCPRCGDYFDWSMLTEGVAGVGGVLERPVVGFQVVHAPEPIELDVLCVCDVVHPGAQPGVKGCGVAFRVRFGGKGNG